MIGFAVRRLRIRDFIAVVHVGNEASARLIEGLGFTMKDEDRKDGWSTYRYRSECVL
jgi:RimJ/RimL family protein N-acetyltransferase